MNLIALAVPFFLLLIAVELAVDRIRDTGHYRSNDGINSISTGIISTTTDYFTKIMTWSIWTFVLAHFAIFEMPRSWFDASPSGVALWLLAAIGWDFCYYWYHRMGHEMSILWAAHSVHHQSEDYNLSTALRQTSTGFLFGWIFYLPLFLIGFPLDVLLTVGAVNLIYQFWVHTQHINRLGVLDRVLVTPSNHRVHHAQNETYIDKNYGGILILWDRLFGSFSEELTTEPVVFGVRKPLKSWNPIWANLQVYDYLLFDARHTRRLRDKLSVWFRRTGWRPEDMEEKFPKVASDLATFEKFDPESSGAQSRYVLAQFALVALSTFWIGDVFSRLGAVAVLVPCLFVWVSLYTLGLLNEGRPLAIRFEQARLAYCIAALFVGVAYRGLSCRQDSVVFHGRVCSAVTSMLKKTIIKTGTPWEPLVGYSRAVRVGPHVAVSGCAPVDVNGDLVGAWRHVSASQALH